MTKKSMCAVLFVTASLCLQLQVWGGSFSATGNGSSPEKAKADALSSLSKVLYSNVSSSTVSLETADSAGGLSEQFSENISISSELPLLGYSFSDIIQKEQQTAKSKRSVPQFTYMTAVTIDSDISLPLYIQEIERQSALIRDIETRIAAAHLSAGDNISTGEKVSAGERPSAAESEKQMYALLAHYQQLEKLLFPARALGYDTPADVPRSAGEVEFEISSIARIVDSMERAASVIAGEVEQTGVYVYPPKFENRGSVTEFADVFAQALRTALGSRAVYDAEKAAHILLGTYFIEKNGSPSISVHCRVQDKAQNIVGAAAVKIPAKVYEVYSYVPAAYDFQKEFERGNAVHSDFAVDIRINGKKDYLSFTEGEQLLIEIKANQPCYVYLVGYVYNDKNEQFSYVFPLTFDASGKDMFVHKISPDMVNTWMLINPVYQGEVQDIDIIPPFGLEMIHVFAATEKNYQAFLERIPSYYETESFYMISGKPVQTLRGTRALNIKKAAEASSREVKNAEAQITYTTSKK